jgi:hypothetical protein
MTATTSTERTRLGTASHGGPRWTRLDSVLAHPLAILATAVLLLAIFGWTFVANPDRVAPTKDPAYYTWRTEVLIAEEPTRLLEIEGAFNMFAGGYRVAAPVIGGLLRGVPEISSLNVTVLIMVALPVGTALLLGGFAYRHRRDPLVFHSVAIAAASLFLTPPFVGYLDNMLCLFFLAAALPFVAPVRHSWPARFAFGIFLLLAGLTHPTTLAIFGLTLGAMSIGRLIYRRFDLRSVVRDDGPLLLTALAGAVVTLAIWTVGIWGRSTSLTEAALPPPYGSDFFVDRLVSWVDTMRPALNGPLFLIGAIGILAAGRRAAEDELSRVSIVWLAPLAGLFGFVAGLAYPYYRFFNTTLAWILLIGVGAALVLRFFLNFAAGGGTRRFALLGVAAIAFLIATNFTTGLDVSGWNRSEWLSPQERADLDALRVELASTDPDTPVVFVIDDEPGQPFQIWGSTKLAGNTSRYGLPSEQIDRAYLYLGSLENYFAGEPTLRGEETYDKLSPELLEDEQAGAAESDEEPIVVVAEIFNPAGANAEIASGETQPTVPSTAEGVADFERLWILHDGTIDRIGESVTPTPPEDDASFVHLVRAVVGLALLLLPGALALRFFLPDAGATDAAGLVPALGVAISTLAGIAVLALTRAPFSAGLAWVSLGLAILIGGVLLVFGRRAARSS